MNARARAFLLAALLLLGAAPVAGAIVGGRPAAPASAPWLAWFPECGGTLVAPDRVLTAAHCVNGLAPDEIGAVAFAGGRSARAARVAVHPGYVRRAVNGTLNPEAPEDDVALILLARPVRGVTPLPLTREGPPGGGPASSGGATAGRRAVPSAR
ncbi:MAG TPA: trypsin-like serine protease [Solirubrobacteraceae bacterium]